MVMIRPLKILLGWLGLGLITGLLAVTFARASAHTPPETAFLVKSPSGYSLVYFDQGSVVAEEFRTLKMAFQAASNQRLEVTSANKAHSIVDRVWSERDGKKTVLYWKMSSTALVNRLTFDQRADADFFREAFLSGAYSPSPHGHSIFFVRR